MKLKEILVEKKDRNKDSIIKNVLSVTNTQGFVSQIDYFERNIHSKNISNYKIINRNEFAYNPSRINVGSISLLENFEKGALSPMYVVFMAKEDMVIPKFFKYYTESHVFRQNVLMNTQGTVRDSLSFESLCNFDVDFPNKAEQLKIIKLLENLDSLLNKIETKITLEKERFNYVKNKLINRDYPKREIGEIFSRLKEKNENLETENVLTISAQQGLISQTDFFNKSVAGKNLKNYYLIKKGDFAYNKSYSKDYRVGATKMLEKYEQGIVSTLYICFRKKEEKSYNNFYKYIFEGEDYFNELDKITQEGNRNHGLLNMNIEDFFHIKIPCPDFDTQKDIGDQLERYSCYIEKYNQLYEKYFLLKKGLLQRFFK